MAESPRFKIFDQEGNYQASFKDVYDAVRFMSICENGWNIRDGHSKKSTVFTQGADMDAGESYDQAVDIIAERMPYYFERAN